MGFEPSDDDLSDTDLGASNSSDFTKTYNRQKKLNDASIPESQKPKLNPQLNTRSAVDDHVKTLSAHTAKLKLNHVEAGLGGKAQGGAEKSDRATSEQVLDPRTRMRHLLASRLVVKSSPYPLDDDRVWSVSCVMVPPAQRRRGIGAALLHGAIAYASESGATAIEGYPIDVDQRGGKLPSGFSTGTLGMFAAEGFATVAALPSGRTLVHRPLAEETGR